MIHPARQHLLDAIQRNGAVESDLFARVQSAAHDADTSPFSRRHPTQAQLEANSYRTGRVDIQGLPIRIETPRGARREKPGKFSNLMLHHYGDIKGTVGNDGDAIDVFIGPFPELPVVYVVNQVGREREFDEHKVCMGFASVADARMGYLSAYAPGWDGLDSIVRATMAQFKWWLQFGDKSRPFTPDVLPYEGQKTMDKVLWNSQAEPVTKPLNAIIYELRGEDAGHGLMLDALSMAELMADPDIEAVPVLDAMVVEVGRLQPKMEILQRIMAAAGETVKPTEMAISDPVRYKGAAQVMVLFTMSDGQTVSVWFHNPDTTPAKLMPLDELISWKWMLNKKDVTIVVAPERGRDLNPREVARRMMRLVERNSAAFLKANTKVAEKAAQLQALDTEIAELQAELTDVQRQIEVAKVEKEDRSAAAKFERSYPITVEAAIASGIIVQRTTRAYPYPMWEVAGDPQAKKFKTGLEALAHYFNVIKPAAEEKERADEIDGFADAMQQAIDRKVFAIAFVEGSAHVVSPKDGSVSVMPKAQWRKQAFDFEDAYGIEAMQVGTLENIQKVSAALAGPKEAPSFDDFLAAVVIELSTKANMSPAEAKKLTDDEVTNLVRDGFDDKTPASQVADQILAANKRSPAVERAYAIAGILMTQYGWSKSDENEYPETGVLVDSPRDRSRWVQFEEQRGALSWDAPKAIMERAELAHSAEYLAAMQDADIAQAFDRADFEAETGTDDDGLIEEGEEFAGKTPAFAYAAEMLRKGAAAAGATVQFGDFSGSSTDSMFDKAAPAAPYAEASVYGITAQIGLAGKVLARASIDEDGGITLLKGSGGMQAAGEPATSAEVRQIVADLMKQAAKEPNPPAAADRDDAAKPVAVGKMSPVYAPFAAVEYIKRFMGGNPNAVLVRVSTDDGSFSRSKVLKSDSKAVITRATNELWTAAGDATDAGASSKVVRAATLGPINAAELLREEGVQVTDEMPAGLLPLAVGAKYDVAITAADGQPVDPIRFWQGATFAGLESWNSQGLKLDLKAKFRHEASSTLVNIPYEDVSKWVDSGWIVPAKSSDTDPQPSPADAQDPEEANPIAAVDAAYKFTNASDAFKSAVVGSIDQDSYSPFLSAKNIDEAAKKHGATVAWRLAMVLDSVGDSVYEEDPDGEDDDFDAEAEFDACPDGDDAVLDALILDGDFKGHPFRGNQYKKASSESGSAVRSSMKAKHAEKHGDPKAQKKAHKTAYFAHMAAAEDGKGKARSYHRKMAKFHGGRSGVVLDSVEESLILDDADAYESIVGTIKKGSKIVGRAHVGGDGKSMIFLGKTGKTRVAIPSGRNDGQLIRNPMYSDDDVGYLVDALFTVPENGVAKAAPAVPTSGKKPIDPKAAGDMQSGDVVIDGKGVEYLALRARQDFLEVAPFVGGKPNVSADTTFMFHLNPETASAFTERRNDPVYATGKNYYGKTPTSNLKRSTQFLSYMAAINEGKATPGMLEQISTDARLEDGEAEILIAEAKRVTPAPVEPVVSAEFDQKIADDEISGTGKAIRQSEVEGKTEKEIKALVDAWVASYYDKGDRGEAVFVGDKDDGGKWSIIESERRPAGFLVIGATGRYEAGVNELGSRLQKLVMAEGVSGKEPGRRVPGLLVASAGKVAKLIFHYVNGSDARRNFKSVKAEGVDVRYTIEEKTNAEPPMQDPQKSTDTAYLQSLINGTGDLLAPDVFDKLEPMFATYEGDAEMTAMLERAAEAYGNAAVEAAKQALAA